MDSNNQLTLWIFMVVMGLLLHFFKRLGEAGTLTSFKAWLDFWFSDIPRSITSIIGSVILFVAVLEIYPEYINSFSAAMCGYAGNSAASMMNKIIAAIGTKINGYISKVT